MVHACGDLLTCLLDVHEHRHVCGSISVPRQDRRPSDRRNVYDAVGHVSSNLVLPFFVALLTVVLCYSVSNLGGTFPKFFILKFVDLFTKATCIPPTDPIAFSKAHPDITPITNSFSCALESDKHTCLNGGGTCVIQRDGYYITNVIFVIIGAVLFWTYIEKKALALQALPLRAWRVQGDYRQVATS